MGSVTVFLIGLVCLLVFGGLYCAVLVVRQARAEMRAMMGALRASSAEVVETCRELGIDPDMARLHLVAKIQSMQQPGWHPLERVSTRMAMRAWKQSLRAGETPSAR